MTNFVKQKYQYFVDLQTDPNKIQVLTFTAGGLMPQARLRPFFGAFKHFKLGKCRYRFVPAATLPVDPTGLSYEAGENTVDPRDQMNPGLVRITNGEDVNDLLAGLGGADAERMYYATMLDPRWYKFQLQRGFKRTAYPLMWNVGQTHQSISQTLVGQTFGSALQSSIDDSKVFGLRGETDIRSTPVEPEVAQESLQEMAVDDFSQNILDTLLMQTGRVKMGWMPTDMCNSGLYGPNAVPEVDLVTVILPKAYKTVYYYRLYIEEEVLFKDPVAMLPIYRVGGSSGISGNVNAVAMDRYIRPAANLVSNGNNSAGVTALMNDGTNKDNGGRES